MAHVRKQIREAAAAALTGLTTAGPRVFQSRVYPLRQSDLPCLLVNTDEEDVDAEVGVSSMILERSLRLSVRGVAKESLALDDTLDAMLEEVEAVLNGATYSGLAKTTALTSVRIQMESVQDKPVGVIEMGFTVTYFTAGGTPGTAI